MDAFILIPLVLAGLLTGGVWLAWRRDGASHGAAIRAALLVGAAAAGWMALTWQVAASGALRRWDDTPPPFALLVAAIFLLAIRLAFSRMGTRLARHIPLWALVGVQAFRYPLEVAMHRMYERGVMPVQMSYEGLNFDIVTGVTAMIVAALVLTGRAGRRVVLAWNILGSVLLANIIVVSILSTPRFRVFGDENLNTWVSYPPYVWLPSFMVLAALAGHLLIFRALRMEARRRTTA